MYLKKRTKPSFPSTLFSETDEGNAVDTDVGPLALDVNHSQQPFKKTKASREEERLKTSMEVQTVSLSKEYPDLSDATMSGRPVPFSPFHGCVMVNPVLTAPPGL